MTSTISVNRELASFIRKHSYREGDFTLVSGKKSSFYIDLKSTTLHPEGARRVAQESFRRIQQEGFFETLGGVGGLTMGADPLATALSLEALAHGKMWPAVLIRKEAKAHGTSRYIEGVENLARGASVLVLEDVTTTGQSAEKAIERLVADGFQVAAVLTVVDREQGAREFFAGRQCPFISLLKLSDIQAAAR